VDGGGGVVVGATLAGGLDVPSLVCCGFRV